MKFDCGETFPEKRARLSQWHRFFCIWPRRVGEHDCRWLEYIQRKGNYSYCSWDDWEVRYEYRAGD